MVMNFMFYGCSLSVREDLSGNLPGKLRLD